MSPFEGDFYGLVHKEASPDFIMKYGSGAKMQKGREGDKPTLDMILAVPDVDAWHKAHIKSWRSDYSLLGAVAQLTGIRRRLDDVGVGIWYHPDLKRDGGLKIKYGVMETSRLVKDLTEWSDVYVAGRLQKPVDVVYMTEKIADLQKKNLQNALRTGLLLCDDAASKRDLFVNIAGISYNGDTRKSVGGFRFEKASKVTDLVDGNLVGFENLYLPLMKKVRELKRDVGVLFTGDTTNLGVNTSDSMSRALADSLPIKYSKALGSLGRPEIVAETMAYISERVRAGSRGQTFKGVISAKCIGVPYALAKFKKGLKT